MGGNFECVILGNGGLNSNANTILNNIAPGYEILFAVGKSSPTNVMRGMIHEISIQEPTKDKMYIKLSGWDWGTDIMKGRKVQLFREQARLANGKDPDPDDTSTNLKKITMLLLGIDADTLTDDESAYPGDANNLRVSVKDQGIVVDGDNIIDTGKSVPRFEININQSVADAIAAVNSLQGTISYVNADKEFIMHLPFTETGGIPTGILFTDDPADSAITDVTKYGIIMKPPSGLMPTTILSVIDHRRQFFALDETQGQPDQSYEDVDFAGENNGATYLATQFTPTKRKCSAIAVYISKNSSPTLPVHVELREDLAGTPNGSLVAASEKLPGSIEPTADWHYFPVNKDLNTLKPYWIVVTAQSDGTNNFTWRRSNVSVGTSATSSDGVTWTPKTYQFWFRQDYTDDVVSIFPGFGLDANTKHYWEEVIKSKLTRNNYAMVAYLQAQWALANKRKDTVRFTVISPDTPLQSGMKVRVRKQMSGYQIDDYFVLGNITYQFVDSPAEVDGQLKIDVEATKFSTYT